MYLIINSATRHFKEKNDEKYLILDSTDKYEEVWSGIRSEIKITNGGKELLFKKNCAKIVINTNADLRLNKSLKHWQSSLDAFFKRVKNCIHKFT